ncbi:MAG: type IV secretory system conjugative DNA transfer family protein, partial [Sphingobium sp.]
MAGPLIGAGRPISWRLAIGVAVIVLFVSNARFMSMYGRGFMANDVPLLLFGLILFATWRINRSAANRQNGLLGSARFGDRADVRKLEAKGDLLIGRSAKSGKL